MLIGKKEWQILGEEFKELKEKIARIERVHEHHQTANNDTHQLLKGISERVEQLENNHVNYGQEFSSQVSRISENNDQMQKRITSFKILHDQASKKLLEDMNLELKSKMDVLFSTKKNYEEQEKIVNNNLVLLNQRLEAMGSEISKFKQIAQEIKTTDFELTNFARKVTQEDAEKLRLIRENEKLKMLVARMRGGRR
tara:strand:- start:523 stop:1113 length:591 start_codon:yes stop_codon:yes gene_type:complete